MCIRWTVGFQVLVLVAGIDAIYNLTEHDVHNEARFEDSIGIYPEFIDGTEC